MKNNKKSAYLTILSTLFGISTTATAKEGVYGLFLGVGVTPMHVRNHDDNVTKLLSTSLSCGVSYGIKDAIILEYRLSAETKTKVMSSTAERLNLHIPVATPTGASHEVLVRYQPKVNIFNNKINFYLGLGAGAQLSVGMFYDSLNFTTNDNSVKTIKDLTYYPLVALGANFYLKDRSGVRVELTYRDFKEIGEFDLLRFNDISSSKHNEMLKPKSRIGATLSYFFNF